MKKCSIKAKGCQGEFKPKTLWQSVCFNEECRREHNRRKSNSWYQNNKIKKKKYNEAYYLV